MPKLYRSMKEDGGKPALGESAVTLGVRVPTDICPNAANDVHPGTGGMSVSPSLLDLPGHRIPRRLQPRIAKASGKNEFYVWCMGNGPFVADSVADGLRLRPDPGNSGHGFVEPETVVPLSDYQAALGATQSLWTIDEETE